jgi:hypothetical protein
MPMSFTSGEHLKKKTRKAWCRAYQEKGIRVAQRVKTHVVIACLVILWPNDPVSYGIEYIFHLPR